MNNGRNSVIIDVADVTEAKTIPDVGVCAWTEAISELEVEGKLISEVEVAAKTISELEVGVK